MAGCDGTVDVSASGPQKVDGSAAPADDRTPTGSAPNSPSQDGTAPSGDDGSGSSGSTGSTGSSSPVVKHRADDTCHTSDLKASFGPNHPGAGQEGFALILTNRSGHTCTVRGYPGLAFINSAGQQVSFDPHRASGETPTVEISPGMSASAPLTFSNPKMTHVTTVVPDAVKITPPDERTHLVIPWSGGPVTNTGKASVPEIGPLHAGSDA